MKIVNSVLDYEEVSDYCSLCSNSTTHFVHKENGYIPFNIQLFKTVWLHINDYVVSCWHESPGTLADIINKTFQNQKWDS